MIFIQLTGLSGAGKSTLASNVRDMLKAMNLKVEVIDGDAYRQTICKDLGFSKDDRIENIRRLGTLANVLVRNDVVAIMAAINPYESVRQELKTQYDNVHTVWVNCDLETLFQRDTKGLYRRAILPKEHPDRINNLTGIDDPFEQPENPDLIINTDKTSVKEASRILLDYILANMPSASSTPSYEEVWMKGSPKALFVGRWQPFHKGHQWIIEQKLAQGIPVLIAVRDMVPDEKNPLTPAQTIKLIETVYAYNPMVSTMLIPDIESINYGRTVGYQVNEIVPPTHIAAISASEIRQRLQEGSDAWKAFIDPSIHQLLGQYFTSIYLSEPSV